MSKTAHTLVKGSTLRTIFFAAQVVTSFLLTPFIVLSLGDRMYGFWTLVVTFIGYYGLLDLGLAYAVNRYIASAIGAKDDAECSRVFNSAFILFSIAGIAALFVSVLIIAFTPLIVDDPQNTSLFIKVILILGVNMAIELPLRAYLGALSAQLRFDIIAVLQLLTLVLRTAAIVTVLMLGYQVLGMALATVVSSIPQKILTIYFAKKNLARAQLNRKGWKLSTAKNLIKYSLYSFLWKIADILKFHVDVIVIGAFLNLSAVTHYRIGGMLALHMQMLMGALIGFMMPVFSRLYGNNDLENMKKTFFFVNKISIYTSSFIAFGFIFWGEAFIERWMGVDYLDAYPVLFILVLALLFAFFQVPSIEILLGTTGYKFVGVVNVIEALTNLLLSLILVQYLGLVGVALGTLIPMTVVKFFIQPVFVIRCLHIGFVEYALKIARTIVVASASLIFPCIISVMFVRPNYDVLFAVGFICFAIYAASIWFWGFDTSEVTSIRNTMRIGKTGLSVPE